MIGIIIAVAAVFEIHMEMNIVTQKSPKLNLKNINGFNTSLLREAYSIELLADRVNLLSMTTADSFNYQQCYPHVKP